LGPTAAQQQPTGFATAPIATITFGQMRPAGPAHAMAAPRSKMLAATFANRLAAAADRGAMHDVCRCIIIGHIRATPLATDSLGEQALNAGKASEIAQIVAPSPGSAISSVTSTHDVTRSGSRSQPRLGTLF
jgi:hypothetical protein